VFERGFKTWCERVSIQQRRELNLAATDPLDPRRVADRLKVKIWAAEEVPELAPEYLNTLLYEDSSSWSAVTIKVALQTLIILNSSHSKARQSSDLMHELAHLIIGHESSRIDVSEDGLLMLHSYDKKQEDEANWLAGCLLLPRDVLMFVRRQRLSNREIQTKYGVSPEMLDYRLRMSGVDLQLSRAKSKRTGRQSTS
jgi:hypothetical protein